VNDLAAPAHQLTRVVPGLRAVLLFGSTLAHETRSATSIPDLVAIVEDVDDALAAFDVAPFARQFARSLPPITVALRAPGAAETLAKVNLISFAAARAAFARPDDLSLAGRLAKKTRLLWARDARAHDETAALLAEAADVMARATTLALPRVVSLEDAIRCCFALSYRAEPRPENAAQIASRYQAFAADYRARYGPRLVSAAAARGIELGGDSLVDRRPASVRRRDARALARLLFRSRARALVRWSRQLLVYRGWLPYLAGKLRRSWAGGPSLRAATRAPSRSRPGSSWIR
jgi:hypothetical protein